MSRIPAPNAQVTWPTPLEGSLHDSLPAGHFLWPEGHAAEELRFHPGQQACPVIGHEWHCPSFYVGQAHEPSGRSFVIRIYEVDSAAAEDLKAVADHDMNSSNPDEGRSAMPSGSRLAAFVVVRR